VGDFAVRVRSEACHATPLSLLNDRAGSGPRSRNRVVRRAGRRVRPRSGHRGSGWAASPGPGLAPQGPVDRHKRPWSRCRWPAGATPPEHTHTTAGPASTSERATTPSQGPPRVVARAGAGASCRGDSSLQGRLAGPVGVAGPPSPPTDRSKQATMPALLGTDATTPGLPFPGVVARTRPGCAPPGQSPERWSPTQSAGGPHSTTDLPSNANHAAGVTRAQTTPQPGGDTQPGRGGCSTVTQPSAQVNPRGNARNRQAFRPKPRPRLTGQEPSLPA
jgi:hypothetical protein